MSRIPSTGPIQDTASTGQARDLREVEMDDFLHLMITELQNQDPLNPMDNSELVQQMSQIREISATDKLTETLDSLLTGQNLGTASSLIGKEVAALTDTGEEITGVVERVSVQTGEENKGPRSYRLHVGEQQVNLKNVRQVVGRQE